MCLKILNDILKTPDHKVEGVSAILKNSFDAVLIPGGGLSSIGKLPAWTISRLDLALEVAGDAFFIPLSAGTVHKPLPLDEGGYPIFESHAAASYLVLKGVAPAKILLEASSFDTIGNAYFSRVIHVEPRRLRRLLVITSAFHMPRTEATFKWVYGLEPVVISSLEFKTVPNTGMPEDVLLARVTKERAALENLKPLVEKLSTLEDFHRWLFGEHRAYTVGAKPRRLSGRILDTY